MKQIKIDMELNKPCLMIDGKNTVPILYGLSDFPAARSDTQQAYRNIQNFSKAGVELVNVDSDLRLHCYGCRTF